MSDARADLERRVGVAAEVRIGIHTGRVVISDLGNDAVWRNATRSSGSSRTSPPGSSRRPNRGWSSSAT